MLKFFVILLLPFYLHASCTNVFRILTGDKQLNQEIQKTLKIQQLIPSFANTHEGLLDELYQIQQQIPSKGETRRILKEQLGYDPTMKEMLASIKQQYHDQFLIPLEKLSQKYPSFENVSNEVVTKVKHTFDRVEKNMLKHGDTYELIFNPHNDHHLQIIAGYISRGYGEIGEAISVAKTKNFIFHSLHLGSLPNSSLLELIKQKIKFATRKIAYSDLEFLIEAYPHIFHRQTHKGKIIDDPAEILKRGLDWILSKEIDVVSNLGNGIMAWTEVKNYDFPFGVEKLFIDHSHGKSVGHQLQGYLEIINFLDLQDVVKIRIHFEGGIQSRARTAIEKMGVLVI